MRRFKYVRIAPMHYAVFTIGNLIEIGSVWRTREGWRYRVNAFGPVHEAYGVSREVAAGVLLSKYNEIHEEN